MSKKIEDYLNLYLGCRIAIAEEKYQGNSLKLIGLSDMGCQVRDEGIKLTFYVNEEHIKPILRPLSSMTEEELMELTPLIAPGQSFGPNDFHQAMKGIKEKGIDAIAFDDNDPRIVFEMTRWLLSKHFDLFDLIPDGLAIASPSPNTTNP